MNALDASIWGSRVADIGALEGELGRMRRASAAQADDGGRMVARTAVLNVVVYADRELHARRAALAMAHLSDRHPARAIVILGDRPGGPAPVTLELRCHVPLKDGSTQICYEQILARVTGAADDRLASVVIPLLVPDLPIFVWWTGTPPRDARRFADLMQLGDRLILDSADFARPAVTLPYVAELTMKHRYRRFGITDLNWTRVTPWRELIAGFFDVAAWRPFLDEIVGVRVGFSVDPDGRVIHPSQALLLVGWLASLLGWQAVEALAPAEAGGLLFRMARGDGAPVDVRVRPRFERGIEPGDTSGVRIQARAGEQLVEFVLKRVPDPRHVTATVLIDGDVRSTRVVPLPAQAIDELLREELAIVSSDHVYEDALQALVALA